MKTIKKNSRRTRVARIVVHCTGTRPGMRLKQVDALPYHYLVTQGGKLLNLKPVKDVRKIEIAWLGGLDKFGRHVDNRTPAQSETLFISLLRLTEHNPRVRITAADQLYPYGFDNPGFDLMKWLDDYIANILQA